MGNKGRSRHVHHSVHRILAATTRPCACNPTYAVPHEYSTQHLPAVGPIWRCSPVLKERHGIQPDGVHSHNALHPHTLHIPPVQLQQGACRIDTLVILPR